jgi:hypothetical protein
LDAIPDQIRIEIAAIEAALAAERRRLKEAREARIAAREAERATRAARIVRDPMFSKVPIEKDDGRHPVGESNRPLSRRPLPFAPGLLVVGGSNANEMRLTRAGRTIEV